MAIFELLPPRTACYHQRMVHLDIKRFSQSLVVLTACVSLIAIVPHAFSVKGTKPDNFNVTGISSNQAMEIRSRQAGRETHRENCFDPHE